MKNNYVSVSAVIMAAILLLFAGALVKMEDDLRDLRKRNGEQKKILDATVMACAEAWLKKPIPAELRNAITADQGEN